MRISDWSSDLFSSDLPQPSDADRITMGERMARTLPDGHCGTVYRHRQTAAARWSDHRLRCADHLYRRAIARSLHGHRRSRKACAPRLSRRSEEHTSELQSLMRISYAVFCLKKTKHKTYTPYLVTKA